MKKEDETIEKLLTIEKAINEMVDLRQRILELKESETHRQMAMRRTAQSRIDTEPSSRIYRKNYS
jgi:hypothetical protein